MRYRNKEVISDSEAKRFAWNLCKKGGKFPTFDEALDFVFRIRKVVNQLLAMSQCVEREIAPGPLATYPQWEALGRHVLRGQKALLLCVPITTKTRAPTEDEMLDVAPTEQPGRVFFTYRARWFVLSQTDGDPYEPVSVPAWSEERALTSLGIKLVPFDHQDGNVQGYATPHGAIAINPVAALPHKTHEGLCP